jgi:hypothetical protein
MFQKLGVPRGNMSSKTMLSETAPYRFGPHASRLTNTTKNETKIFVRLFLQNITYVVV